MTNLKSSFKALLAFSCIAFTCSCNPLVSNPTTSANYNPGVQLSLPNSTLSSSLFTVVSGNTALVTLAVKDQDNNLFYDSHTKVDFSTEQGTSTGSFGAINDLHSGMYQTSFIGATAGTPTQIHARINGVEIASTFSITVIPNSLLNLSLVSGDNAFTTVATAIQSPMTVKVVDSAGNPVSNIPIEWAIPSGGSFPNSETFTNANGVATNGLTFGTLAGTFQISAKISGSTVAPVIFSEVATAGAPSSINKITGDSQTGTVNTTLTNSLKASVLDAYGNLVPGVQLDWSVTGGGSIPAATTSTDSAGISSQTLSLGNLAGASTATITVHGTSVQTSFSELAIAAAPASVVIVSGNSQNGIVGQALGAPFIVAVKDVYNNPVPSAALDWSVISGSGSFGNASLTTGPNGQSSQTLILGSVAGTNSATVTVHGQPSLSATFSSVAFAGSATSILVSSGNNQSGIVAHTLGAAFTTIVTDANSNPVPNAQVDWSVVVGGGTISSSSTTTNSLGLTSVTLNLGNTATLNRVRATLHATGGSVVFAATANADFPASLSIYSGNNQSSISGTQLSAPLVVLLTDTHANPVQGAIVNFTLGTGGGSIFPAYATTDVNGLAQISLTLGTSNGTNSVTAALSGIPSVTFYANAQSGGVSSSQSTLTSTQTSPTANGTNTTVTVTLKDANGNPVAGKTVGLSSSRSGDTITAISAVTNAAGLATFNISSIVAGSSTLSAVDNSDTIGVSANLNLTFVPGAAVAIALAAGNSQTGVVGSTLTNNLKSLVTDANGNVVTGATVDYLVISGSGSLSSASVLTDSSGAARDSLTLGTVSGIVQVTATLHNTSSSVTFNVTALAGTASTISLSSGNSQNGVAGSALASPLQVLAFDSNGNLASGGIINWSVGIGGGSLSNSSTTTNSSGVGSNLLTLGVLTGTNTVVATLNGTSSSVIFTATGTAGSAVALSLSSGNSQSSTAGTSLASLLQVTAKDSNGNLVSNTQIDWLATSGGGIVSANSSTTSSLGIASVSATLGATVGINTFSATLHGTSTTIIFTETGVAGLASTIAVLSGSGQNGVVNTSLTSSLIAVVKDTNGNPVPGVAVTWNVTANNGTLSSCTSASDSNGQSSCSYTLGTLAGTNSITASVSGVATYASFSAAGVAGSPNKLAFSTIPSASSIAGAVLSAQPNLIVQDTNGNTVNSSSASIALSAFSDSGCTVAIPNAPNGSATLGGTLTLTAIAGLASYTGISVTKSGPVYLQARSSGLSSACSSLITVLPGSYSTSLSAVTISSGTVTSGSSVSTTLTTKDAYGNLNPSGLPTLTSIIFTSTSTGGNGNFGVISSLGGGIFTANFTGVSSGNVSIGATISSTAVGINASVTVGAASASLLTFSTAPSTTNVAGLSLSSQPVLTVQDANGNTVTTSSAPITIAAFSDNTCGTAIPTTASGAATLGGTLNQNASAGVATFSGISANRAGAVYIQASASGLISTCSSLITVSPGGYSVSRSIVVASATTVNSGASVSVTLKNFDLFGNTNATGLPAISSIAFNSSTVGGTGTFGPITDAGSGWYTTSFTGVNAGAVTLSATISGSAAGTNQSITVNAGTATKLAFTIAPPSLATAGLNLSLQPTVTIQDARGNTVTSSSASVSLATYSDSACSTAIATTPNSSATLSGTLTLSANSGVAAFSSLSANRAGAVYLKATASGLSSACSSLITVAPGAFSSSLSAVTVSASTVASGSSITSTLTTADSFGNPNPSGVSTSNVLFTSSAVGGTGTFGTISSAGSGVFTSSFTGLLAGAVSIGAKLSNAAVSNSASVTVTTGSASQIIVASGNNQSASDGALLISPMVATVEDAAGNAVGSGVTVAWAVSAGNGTLGTCTVTTNSSSQVQCGYTFGYGLPGSNTITATASGIVTPASFSETGTAVSFSNTWVLSSGTNYTYNSSYVDFTNGYAELTPANQTDSSYASSSDFMGGTLTSTVWDSSSNKFLRLSHTADGANASVLELDSSWTPAWSNLVGYWKLNEATGSASISDNSGNGVNGSVVGTTLGATGQLKTAASFAGNQYIDLGTSLNNLSNTVTFSAWIKGIPTSGQNMIFAKGNDQVGSFALNIYNGQPYCESTTGGLTYATTANFSSTNWSMVTCVYSGTSIKVFVNGSLQGSGTSHSPIAASSYSLWIGAQNRAGYAYSVQSGSIDDLAIWNVALSSNAIANIYQHESSQYAGTFVSRVMNAIGPSNWTTLAAVTTLPYGKELPDSPTASSPVPNSENSTNYSSLSSTQALMQGIVGLWHFDEASGTSGTASVKDRSGQGNDATPTSATFGVPGKLNNSVSFNGSSTVLNVSSNINVNTLSQLTLSVWAYANALPTSGNMAIFGFSSAGTWGACEVHFGTAGVGWRMGAGSSSYAHYVGNNPTIRTWHHIVVTHTYPGSDILYYDGVALGTYPSGQLINNSSTIQFGADNLGDSNFNGLIDEASVWTRALSSVEISGLYRRGANRIKYQVRSCPDSSCSTSPTWLGPDGTNQSYYSELNNNAVPSDGGDLTASDSVNTASPTVTFANFASPTPANNQYFQYRAIMESDDTGTNCNYGAGATWCSPEVQSVSIGPNHYTTTAQTVVSKTGVSFASLNALVETLGTGGCTSGTLYNLSPDGSAWYYLNGSSWAISNGSTAQATSASAITASSLTNFPTRGTVYFKVFLQSSGSSSCALNALTIGGTQ